jgi:hypothetical protein
MQKNLAGKAQLFRSAGLRLFPALQFEFLGDCYSFGNAAAEADLR